MNERICRNEEKFNDASGYQESGLEIDCRRIFITSRADAGDSLGAGRSFALRSRHRLDRRHHRGRNGKGEEYGRSEEHTSELQSLTNLVCRLLLDNNNSDQLSESLG